MPGRFRRFPGGSLAWAGHRVTGRPGRAVTGTAAAAARTSEPLAAIARRCGFASAETFRQAFVAWAGVPPSRFRAAER
ncbi:helix-turn-helix domain-containing protein [Nonomuraea sp. NPDC050202]|uniref:helix-turn-helix domain-containing protein n=1 Tax=Nonomuraea sp. NPDC050202 TaxID=3155035 RepID=UPI0033D0C748